MAPPSCTAASQSKPPRPSNGSPMSAHSLSLTVCVRMCVRPCVYALPASPPHPPRPLLYLLHRASRCWTPSSIIHFYLAYCSPISGCVHMPNLPFDLSCCPLYALILFSSLSIRAVTKLGPPHLSPFLPPPPLRAPTALPFSDQRKRDSGSLGGSLTFVCAPILHRPPHWSSTGPCYRAGPPPPSGFN